MLMKMMIFICWGILAAGLVSVIAAGHMNAASIAALAGAILCLAGVLFILYQGARKWSRDSSGGFAGKELIFVFLLAAAAIGLAALTVLLQ